VNEPQAERQIVTELRGRIEEDVQRYGGTLPREATVAWEGLPGG
jgi:hypothetical protein